MPARIATWGLAGVLAAGLGAGAFGIASAADSNTTAAKPAPGTSAAPKAGQHDGRHHRPLLARVAHGTGVVHTKSGWQTIAVQRGEITAVSPTSITIRSRDGYSGTYVLNPQTKVRAQGKPEQVSALKAGERAMVVAAKTGDQMVAKRVGCLRDRAAATTSPTSPTSPTSGT